MGKVVTIFSTPHCVSCKALKKWLDGKEVEYTVVDLEENPDRQAEVLQKSGSLSVPVTFITDDGDEDTLQIVNGPNYASLSSALGL